MPTVAKDILDEARSTYLNDSAGQTYNDVVMLPHLRTAYNFLQSTLEANGVPCKNEEVIVTIPANTNELYPLPSDLVVPRMMYERTPGSTEAFRPMSMRGNIPTVPSGPYLEYWAYRLERIFLLAATQAREIKLEYQRSFPAVNTADAVLLGKGEIYLAAKVAALVHMFISQSITLAEAANKIAEAELEDIINLQTKVMQSQPTRRKGYLPLHSS